MRPRGVARFFPAAFLAFWLCGWAAGEVMVFWLLLHGAKMVLAGQPVGGAHPEPLLAVAGVALFLLLWLSLWTVGGFMTVGEFLRLVWSEDRIIASPAGITLYTSRGPFRKAVEIPRDEIRGIVPSARGAALAVETGKATIVLTRNGTADERAEIARMLRVELGLREDASDAPSGSSYGAAVREAAILPPGWEDAISPEGERILIRSPRTREAQARIVGLITLGVTTLAVFVVRQAWARHVLIPPAVLVSLFATGLAIATVRLATARNEWKIGSGRITLQQRFHGKARDVFQADRLELLPSTESGGNERFILMAVTGPQTVSGMAALGSAALRSSAFRYSGYDPRFRRLVDSSLRDAVQPRRLGTWLAQAAGIPFDDRTGRAARDADLATLTAQLEASGALGRLAAKLITRQRERVRKSA